MSLRKKLGAIKIKLYSRYEYLKYILLILTERLKFIRVVPFLFSKSFHSEYNVYLGGKKKYLSDLYKSGSANLYLLRRNIHRLEKGLISKNPKPVFAAGYILETVNEYERLNRTLNGKKNKERSEIDWIESVLNKYFDIVSSHPEVDKARLIYNRIKRESGGELQSIPYKRDFSKELNITYDDYLQLCMRRRSVRWYLQKPVPRELIDKAIQAASQSPSACNRQPFRFLIFDDRELIEKLGKIPAGFAEYYKNIPALAVVIGHQRAFFNSFDRHTIYIDSSLAIMSFLFALEVQGLSSCTINWTDRPKPLKELSKIISLDEDEQVILFISIGYPDSEAKVPYSKKKDLSEIRSYNFE